MVAWSTRVIRLGQFDFPTFLHTWFVNRGRNTGSGPAFVYWSSPDTSDPAGAYYTGPVPFGQLAGIVAVGNFTA